MPSGSGESPDEIRARPRAGSSMCSTLQISRWQPADHAAIAEEAHKQALGNHHAAHAEALIAHANVIRKEVRGWECLAPYSSRTGRWRGLQGVRRALTLVHV